MRWTKLSQVACGSVLLTGLLLLGLSLWAGTGAACAHGGSNWAGPTLDGPEEMDHAAARGWARSIGPEAPVPQEIADEQPEVQVSDDFAEVVGTLPDLFFDNDDSTYVRGGIVPGDYDAVFTLPVKDVYPLKFWTRVQCIGGSCGGKEVCGYRLFIRNQETGEFDRLNGIPWEEAGFHEYEVATEDPDPGKYVRNGVAEFHFSFHCNMDGYVNEFQQIVDGTRVTSQVPAEEVAPQPDVPAEQPAVEPAVEPAEPVEEPAVSFLVVYLNNEDDDTLYVNVHLDGENIGALEVQPGESRIFGKAEVKPGSHVLNASWEDPDTGERYVVETGEDLRSGDEKVITLNLPGHQAPTPTITPTGTSTPTATASPTPTQTPTPSTSTAVVNIKNLDDDALDIVLYVDDDYSGHWIVPDWTNQVEEIEVAPGPHRFIIEWMDPDTGEDYQSVESADFAPGETRKVNVEVERHEVTPTNTPLPQPVTEGPEIVSMVEATPGPGTELKEEIDEPVRALSEEETIQRLEEASGYSEDFPEMYVAVEDEIVDSFSDTVIYADLLVYSASPAGYAVEGQEIKATLFIQNQSDHPVAVAAAIVLPSQDVFKHSEKAYFSSISNIDAWDWSTESAMQFHYGGGAFILDPGHVLTFDSRVIPNQEGYFDVTGEVFYDWDPVRIKAYTTGKTTVLPFALGITVVEYDLDEMKHATLAKSIFVEEKECSWGGLICR